MALMDKKQHQGRRDRRRVYKKRRQTGFYVFIGLVILTLVGLLVYGADRAIDTVLQSDTDSVEQVADPNPDVDLVPNPVSEEAADKLQEEIAEAEKDQLEDDLADKEEALEDEGEAVPTPPGDPTMYLYIPKLGINGAVVLDGEAGLELGAMHLGGTGYPWLSGSNTYIAGHRVGFPGTGSDHIFYNLPSLTAGDEVTLYDSLGQEYTYQVSEVFAVTPFDLWVTEPTGTDVVSLQVCTETPDDWWTIGPRLMSSGPESGRLIVRAVRV